MKASLKKLQILILAAGFLAIVCTGCQTSKGFGRDVENLGENIQGK